MSTGTARLHAKRPLTFETLVRYLPSATVVLLLLIGILTIDGYASRAGIVSILVVGSFLGLAAMGQTLTVIVGGLDLTVPSVIGMANVVLTVLYGRGWSFWAACAVITAISVVIGAANALISVYLRIPALITSLGMNLIVLGATLAWAGGTITGTVPEWLGRSVSVIGTTGPVPIPPVLVLWAVLSVVVIAIQRKTRIGHEMYATGTNSGAARLAHVRTLHAWVFAFVVSSLSAALVGVLYAGYSGSADATVGQPYLFQTITAVVVGGVSLLGGRGGYGQTLLGVLIISQLTTLLVGAGLRAEMQQVLLGCLVILVVALYGREPAIESRI